MLKNIISKAGTEGLSGIERYTSCTSTSYLKQPMLYVQSVVEYYTKAERELSHRYNSRVWTQTHYKLLLGKYCTSLQRNAAVESAFAVYAYAWF